MQLMVRDRSVGSGHGTDTKPAIAIPGHAHSKVTLLEPRLGDGHLCRHRPACRPAAAKPVAMADAFDGEPNVDLVERSTTDRPTHRSASLSSLAGSRAY